MSTLARVVGNALWGPDLSGRPAVVRFAYSVARHAYALVRDLVSGQLTLRAMSLVYITLLSTVPFLAFSFSLIKLFGLHNSLKPQLYRLLEPLGPEGAEMTDAVIGAVDKVQGGVLGTVSLAFFIYTAIAMVQRVESSFNYVWQVTRPRSLGRRLAEYVAVLLIGPVAMTTALGLIASIGSDVMVQAILAIEPFGSALLLAGKVAPYVLVIAVFTFLYKFLPNAPVQLRAAATGGVIAGASWSFVGAFFASILSLSVARNAIYSTFAISIAALIWLYVSWLILLTGAQIAFYVQHPVALRIGRQEPRMSNGLRERIALNVMYLIGLAFRSGNGRCTIRTISTETNIPGLTLGPVIADLEAAGLISAVQDEALVPGRDLSRITLADILAAVRGGCETGALVRPAWSAPVNDVAGRVEAAIDGLTAGTTLSDFLDRGDPRKASA
ncbi:MAG: YihY family inner membrane protein [Chromatiales bacterium]|nr:YihY family inner membrane protein [Chromatiales bacterium]